jgi:uncharacterized protein
MHLEVQGVRPLSQQGAAMRKSCLSVAALVLASVSALPASAEPPSFNCAKATYADERTICSSAVLSQLDNVADDGYEYVRRVYGNQYANSITLPFLHARRACAADVACIKESQLAAITKFQSLGARTNAPQTAQPSGGTTTPPPIISVPNTQSSQPSQSAQQDVPSTDCDVYAADPFDPKRKADGVLLEKLDPSLSIPACENAVGQYPHSSRLIFQLGRAYQKKNNFSSALTQYRRAAEQGYLSAQFNLGVMYLNGQGVAQNYAEAVKWYRMAADQGLAIAQEVLGFMYGTGGGVEHNDVEAVRWLRKAADQGVATAQHGLGKMYENGQGVTQNYAEAVKWYHMAADQGDAMAQNDLGFLYVNGLGVQKNPAEAAKWWRQAADQGNANAKDSLVALAAAGVPETKDIEIRPSFLVSALFFATGLEPPLEKRSSNQPFIDRAHGSIFRTDPKDPCVLIQEGINSTTVFSLPTDCFMETCSRRPANPPTARLVRYDFSLFPSASDADFRQYTDVVTLHLPPDAYCLAKQEQDGTIHPLPGQTCFGSFVMRPGAATRKLQALAYIQREFCPSTVPRKPQLIQPY